MQCAWAQLQPWRGSCSKLLLHGHMCRPALLTIDATLRLPALCAGPAGSYHKAVADHKQPQAEALTPPAGLLAVAISAPAAFWSAGPANNPNKP